jgi:DNA helicase IV
VLLLATTGRESPFLLELVKADRVSLKNVTGETVDLIFCPICKVNQMMIRKGPYGLFYGCAAFPACRGTRQLHETGEAAATAKQS